ncbi:GGDEF domain-containing protein [Metabacillus iocasae]|uniref:Diguanylate cyclase n=1 Tax=Priestia iocasae TaxID=2291674 RepID=A0ABS2QTV6_9BACI|nr:diguanylate cyclase [Metabacillus iocasae]MBM7702900.1 diguanylate cyclase [Metabacillus iocasae]
MEFAKDFFVNICILTSYLFVYTILTKQSPLYRDSPLKVKIMAGASHGFLGNMLMYFSIHINDMMMIDLRNIPIIVSFIFGGWVPGLVSTLLVIGGRFLYGINQYAIHSIFNMSTMFLLYVVLDRCIARRSFKLISMCLGSVFVFSIYFVFFIQHTDLSRSILPIYIIASFLGCLLAYSVKWYLRHTQNLFKRYNQELRTDHLTQLGNVRFFDQKFNQLTEDIVDLLTLSVIMLDIDHFKKINDTFGHDKGDEILKQFGYQIRGLTKSYGEVAFRKGGEEFCILLPNFTFEEALQLSEDIRCETERSLSVVVNRKQAVTVSIGVAHYPEVTVKQLLKTADNMLYQAKRNGRNRVEYEKKEQK